MFNKYIFFFTLIILFGCSKDEDIDLSNAVNVFQTKNKISFVNKKRKKKFST